MDSAEEEINEELSGIKVEYENLRSQLCKLENLLCKENGGEFGLSTRLQLEASKLFNTDKFSDVQVILKGGTHIKAHKMILAASGDDWGVEQFDHVDMLDLTDLRYDVGYALMHWVYTDDFGGYSIQLDDNFFIEMMQAAKVCKLKALHIRCQKALSTMVNNETCEKFLKLSEEFEAKILKENCEKLLKKKSVINLPRMERQFELQLTKDMELVHDVFTRRFVGSDNSRTFVETDNARKTRNLRCDKAQTVTGSDVTTPKKTNKITRTLNLSIDNQTGDKTLQRTNDTNDSNNSTTLYIVPELSKMVTRSRSEAILEKSSSKKMMTRSKAIFSSNPKSIPKSETQSKEKVVVSKETENKKNSNEDQTPINVKRKSPRFESLSPENSGRIKQTDKAEIQVDKSPCKRSLSKTIGETSDSTNTRKKPKTLVDIAFHSSIDKRVESQNVIKAICHEDAFDTEDCDDVDCIPENDPPSPQKDYLNDDISSVRKNESVLSEVANPIKNTLTHLSEKRSSQTGEKSQTCSALDNHQDNLKNSLNFDAKSQQNRLEEFINIALKQRHTKPPDGAAELQDKTHIESKLVENKQIHDKASQKFIHIADHVSSKSVSNVKRQNKQDIASIHNNAQSESKFVVENSQYQEKNTKKTILDTPCVVNNPVPNIQDTNVGINSDISKIVFAVKAGNHILLTGSQKLMPSMEPVLLIPVTQFTSSMSEESSHADSLSVPNYSKVTNGDSLSKSGPQQIFVDTRKSRKKQLSKSKSSSQSNPKHRSQINLTGSTGIHTNGSIGIHANNGSTGIPANNGSTGIQANNGSTGIPANNGSTGIQANNGSTEIPADNGSTEIPADNGSTGIPAKTGIPADNGSTEIPADNGSTEIPANNGSTGIPANNGSTGIQANNGSTEIPADNGSTGIPANNGSTGIQADNGSTEIPANNESTGIQANNGSTGIQANNGPTSSSVPLKIPVSGDIIPPRTDVSSIGKVPTSIVPIAVTVSTQTVLYQTTKKSLGTSISKKNYPNAKNDSTKFNAPLTTGTAILETTNALKYMVLENPYVNNTLLAKYSTHSTNTEISEKRDTLMSSSEPFLINALKKDPKISHCYKCMECNLIFIHYQLLIDHLISHGKYPKPKETPTVDSSLNQPSVSKKSEKLVKIKNPIQSGKYQRQHYRKSYECKHCLKICYSHSSFTWHYHDHVVDIINGTATSKKTPQSEVMNTETSVATSAGEAAQDTLLEIVNAAANFEKSHSGIDGTPSSDDTNATNQATRFILSDTPETNGVLKTESTSADNENQTALNTTSELTETGPRPYTASSDDTNSTNQVAQCSPSNTQPNGVFNTESMSADNENQMALNITSKPLTQQGPRPYKCKICQKRLTDSKIFYKHLNLHLKKSGHASEIAEIQYGPDYISQLIQCEVCGKSVKGIRNLKSHQERHSKTYNCKICGENFTKYNNLQKHNVDCKHNLVDTFRCDICDFSLTTSKYKGPGLLEKHKYREHEIRSHQCHICGRKSSSNISLLSHLRNIHQLEKTFECPHCHKKYASKSILRVHITHHKKEWKNKCSICGKAYQTEPQLTVHMRTHTGERPFRCRYCGKGFIKKLYVKSHELTHSDFKPFVCYICGHSVKTKPGLRVHILKCNKPKPKRIQCDYCAKDFSCRGTFLQHMRRFHKAFFHLYQPIQNYHNSTLPVIDEVTVQTSEVNEVLPLQIENVIDLMDYNDYL